MLTDCSARGLEMENEKCIDSINSFLNLKVVLVD